MIGSAVSAFLSMGAFHAVHLAAGARGANFMALISVTAVWLSFVVLWMSFLCWIAMNLFPDGK